MPHKRSLIGGYLRSHPWSVAAALVLGCLTNALTLLIPLSIGRFYELTGNGHQVRSTLLGQLPFSLGNSLDSFFLIFGALIALRYVLQVMHSITQGWIGEGLSAQLRERLFAAQLSFPESEYAKTGKGKYLLRFSGDLGSIRRFLTRGMLDFTADLVLIAGLIYLLTQLLPDGVLMALLLFGFICVLVLSLTGSVLRLTTRTKNDQQASLLAYINRKLLGASSIQVFNKQVPEEARMRKRSQRLRLAGIRYLGIKSMHDALAPAMVYGSLFLIMAGYAYPSLSGSKSGSVDPNQGAAYLTAMLLLLFSGSVLRRTLKVAGVWKPGRHALEKVQSIFDKAEAFVPQSRVALVPHSRTASTDSPAPLTPVTPVGVLPSSAALVMNQVLVEGSQGNQIALPDLSTRAGRVTVVPVDPEQANALLGLLSGNLKPSSGAATLGKVSLHDVAPFPLRKRITFLSPQLPLVGENVMEAISYSRDKAARLAAERMLLACQEDLPRNLHLQLDDKLKDNGQYLSETQRFRLQAARVLLTGKRLLVLDLSDELVEKSALETFGRLLKRYLLENKASAVVLERSPQNKWKELLDSAAS